MRVFALTLYMLTSITGAAAALLIGLAVPIVAMAHELFQGRCQMGECYWFKNEDRELIGTGNDGELFKATFKWWVSYHNIYDYERPIDRHARKAYSAYYHCSTTSRAG